MEQVSGLYNPDFVGGQFHWWIGQVANSKSWRDNQPKKHFLFRRPVGQEGNNYPSSKYRYGMTWDGLLAPHRGVALANETGTPIVAIGQGTVYYAGDDSTQNLAFVNNFYGNMIILHLNQQWLVIQYQP